MDRKQPINKSIRKIRKDFAMDIIVYSRGEFEYLDRRESDFVREIKNTGIEIYAK